MVVVRKKKVWLTGFLATGILWGAASAQGGITLTASGTNSADGKFLSASVTFDISNRTDLVVTLVNNGAPVYDASDILTAVFFNLNGGVSNLTPVSAVLGPGSVLVNGPTPSGTTLGDFWEYLGGLSGAPNGDSRGISATGFGIFGHGNFGTNSQNLDGGSYGVINGSPAGGNDHIPTKPFENNSMVFTLSGLPIGFSLSSISGVEFQYGTQLSGEPVFFGSPVPEPSLVAILGLGAAAFALRRRTR